MKLVNLVWLVTVSALTACSSSDKTATPTGTAPSSGQLVTPVESPQCYEGDSIAPGLREPAHVSAQIYRGSTGTGSGPGVGWSDAAVGELCYVVIEEYKPNLGPTQTPQRHVLPANTSIYITPIQGWESADYFRWTVYAASATGRSRPFSVEFVVESP